MIKEAIEKIVSLVAPEVYIVAGDTYTTNKNMTRVAPHIDRPCATPFFSLEGIVQAIGTEINRDEIQKPIFVEVEAHNKVVVFTTYRGDNLQRDTLYTATPTLPTSFTVWNHYDDAIIMIRSQFVQNAGTEYLLNLLSHISDEDSVVTEDNGVSQKISATKGIALKVMEKINSRVSLAPFRTFLEVKQPESEFLIRIKKEEGDHPIIGIIEADGGMWKLTARRTIADYLKQELAELISGGSVVVTI